MLTWRNSIRTRLFDPIIRMVTTSRARTGGLESSMSLMSVVSPSDSSRKRLWTFLVPGLTPHESKESEGRRGLSQSERDCGVAKRRWGLGLGLGFEWDIVGILRKRRG